MADVGPEGPAKGEWRSLVTTSPGANLPGPTYPGICQSVLPHGVGPLKARAPLAGAPVGVVLEPRPPPSAAARTASILSKSEGDA